MAGEKKLHEHYQLTTIQSSKFARVHRFTAGFNGINKEVYFKQYLYRSAWDFIKHLIRPSRARRAFKAAMMLAENGFEAPVIIAMGERKLSFFHTINFLVTLVAESTKEIYKLIDDTPDDSDKEQLRCKRELIRAFGRTIGKMHAKGIFHGDLRLGNVLVRREEDGWRFFFLDNERTKKFRRLPARLRLKNLVQINMHRTDALTGTDRMRFFRNYLKENLDIRNDYKTLAKKAAAKTDKRLKTKLQAGQL